MVDGLSHCSPIWIKQPSPQVQGDLNSEQQTQGRASELPLNPQDKGLESWSDWLTWMFGIMFYSEGIDVDSLFSLLTSFDIPETLHLVAPGDHDFAPHWGRLGQYTEISNGFGCLVFFVRWKRSPCSSCEFPSSVMSHRIFLQSLGECHRAGIAVKVVMLELSLATWMRKIGPKMCTGLHPRDPDGFLCERLRACLPCWCGSGGWQPNKGCWRGLLLKSVAKPRFLDIPSTVMTGYGWGDDSFDFLQGKRWMDAFWFRVDLKIMIRKCGIPWYEGATLPVFQTIQNQQLLLLDFRQLEIARNYITLFSPLNRWVGAVPVDQLTSWPLSPLRRSITQLLLLVLVPPLGLKRPTEPPQTTISRTVKSCFPTVTDMIIGTFWHSLWRQGCCYQCYRKVYLSVAFHLPMEAWRCWETEVESYHRCSVRFIQGWLSTWYSFWWRFQVLDFWKNSFFKSHPVVQKTCPPTKKQDFIPPIFLKKSPHFFDFQGLLQY